MNSGPPRNFHEEAVLIMGVDPIIGCFAKPTHETDRRIVERTIAIPWNRVFANGVLRVDAGVESLRKLRQHQLRALR